MVQQGLTRDTELASRRTAIAVVPFQRSTKKFPPEILLDFFPGPGRADLALGDRQMLGLRHSASGSNQRHLDRLAEFTHVAGPRIPPHHRLGLAAPRTGREAVAGHCLSFKKVPEKTDVLPTLSQRWNSQRWGRDAVIEILSKAPFPHPPVEIRVGRRQDADIDGSRLGGTNWAHLLAIEEAEQLDLEGRIEVTDLVEKKGPVVRGYRQTLPRTIRSCVGTLHRTEELGLEEVGRNRRNIDRDERATAGGQAVERSCGDFLPDSGLSDEQDPEVCWPELP